MKWYLKVLRQYADFSGRKFSFMRKISWIGLVVIMSIGTLWAQNKLEMPKPQKGETLYVGEASFRDVGEFKAGFILSADNNTIHDVTFIYKKIEDYNIKGGGVEIRESFPVTSDTIFAGKSTITDLAFVDDGANATINFVFEHYDHSSHGPSAVKNIDMGTSNILFRIVKGKVKKR